MRVVVGVEEVIPREDACYPAPRAYGHTGMGPATPWSRVVVRWAPEAPAVVGVQGCACGYIDDASLPTEEGSHRFPFRRAGDERVIVRVTPTQVAA
jgi:hypothetical protein